MINKIHPCTGIENANLSKQNTDNKHQNLQDRTQKKFKQVLQDILDEKKEKDNK